MSNADDLNMGNNDSNANQQNNSDNNLELDKKQFELNVINKEIIEEIQNKNDLKERALQIKENELDFQKKNKNNYCKKFRGLIKYLDNLDKKISRPLHTFSPSFRIECIFYCFARLFNIDIIIGYLISILIYSYLKYKNCYMVLIPICHVIFGALFTIISKSIIRRPRPNLRTNRYFKLKESTHSMPSGDSLQAGIFATMIIMYNNCIFRYFSILLIPAAMLGRIFYNLHYWFDCLIGATSGIIISKFTYNIINELFFYKKK